MAKHAKNLKDKNRLRVRANQAAGKDAEYNFRQAKRAHSFLRGQFMYHFGLDPMDVGLLREPVKPQAR